MNEIEQRLALVTIAADVDMAKHLLVYESVAAKALKISVREFRRLVDSSVIPCRLRNGRKKRLYFLDDLRAYARSLEAQYARRSTGCVDDMATGPSLRRWATSADRDCNRNVTKLSSKVLVRQP
jgi:hypothetical protein